MLGRLQKLSMVSATLRAAAMKKEAGVLGNIGKAGLAVGKRAGSFALAHPAETFIGGAGTVGAVGAYRKARAGFNPAVHRAQLGME